MICVPLRASSTEEALGLMRRSFAEADMVELRLDGFAEVNLAQLLDNAAGPVLVTNRSRDEGGLFDGTDEERCAPILEAIDHGAAYVDCELATAPALVESVIRRASAGGGKTKVILSFHDFRATPGTERLRELVDRAFDHRCDVAKIVTTATTLEDNLKILNLLLWATERGRPLIAFCMGAKGRISRLAAPLFGSLLTFASLERGRESAPGQFTLQELRHMLELMRE